MTISLKKDRACNCGLREMPIEVERKLALEPENVCMTLGKSLGLLESQFPYLENSERTSPLHLTGLL